MLQVLDIFGAFDARLFCEGLYEELPALTPQAAALSTLTFDGSVGSLFTEQCQAGPLSFR